MRDALSAPGVERRPEPGSAAAGAGAPSRGGRGGRGELSGGATIWIPGGSLKAVRLGWWNSSARAAVEAARPALPEGGCREGGDQPPNPRPRLLARDRLPDVIAVARCAQRPPRD